MGSSFATLYGSFTGRQTGGDERSTGVANTECRGNLIQNYDQIREEHDILETNDLQGSVFRDHRQQYKDLAAGTGNLRAKVCILSIDGGGVKGAIPAEVLRQLEWVLQREVKIQMAMLSNEPQSTGLKEFLEEMQDVQPRTAEFFDVIAGTSTGGLISAMLAVESENNFGTPRYTAAEIGQKYDDLAGIVFPPGSRTFKIRPSRYDSGPLASALQNVFGDKRLDELTTPIVVPTFNFSDNEAMIWEGDNGRLDGTADEIINNSSLPYFKWNIGIWELCRATSAAPTFFPPKVIGMRATSRDGPNHVRKTFVDGGIFSNNPVLHAVSWVQNHHTYLVKCGMQESRNVEDMLILSLGTGSLETDYDRANKVPWCYPQWIKPVIQGAMDGSASAAHQAVLSAFASSHKLPGYCRMQPRLSQNLMQMDNAKNTQELRQQADQEFQGQSHRHSRPDRLANTGVWLDALEKSYFGDNAQGNAIGISQELVTVEMTRFAQMVVQNWLVKQWWKKKSPPVFQQRARGDGPHYRGSTLSTNDL